MCPPHPQSFLHPVESCRHQLPLSRDEQSRHSGAGS
jgi:hypothetical protein